MVIGEIQKSATEIIRISKSEYKGREYVDIRKCFVSDPGEYLPTKKGISIPYDLVEEVLDILKKAIK